MIILLGFEKVDRHILVCHPKGELINQHYLPNEFKQLSIRHLAEGYDGSLCLVTQYQGSRFDEVPLVGFLDNNGKIELYAASKSIQRRMRNYCGSVASDKSGRWMAVSSPRGGIVTVWSVDSRNVIDTVELDDCCGVSGTSTPNQFIVSSGSGDLLLVSISDRHKIEVEAHNTSDIQWDNHLSIGTI